MQTDAEPLRVGTVGWCRPAWCAAYYPEDLPTDWRLAYYANDANCVWLEPEDVAGLNVAAFAAAWGETDGSLEVYCEAAAVDNGLGGLAEVVGDSLILMEPPSDDGGDAVWRQANGHRRVARWHLDTFDLRAARTRIEGLPHGVTGFCLDGPAGSPERLHELRTLFDLLDR